MTAGGYFDRENGEKALALAYQDVERAFIDFLRRRCLERLKQMSAKLVVL